MLATETQQGGKVTDEEREERAIALWQQKQECIRRIAQINQELRDLGLNPHSV